jgi:hypothetical protein
MFIIALFTSALLLFLVQPLFARLVLPLLGGSPAVWTTCMLFFQTMLLAGYAYTHASIRLLGIRRQSAVHAVLVFVPIVLLPFDVTSEAAPSATSVPIPWLLWMMLKSIGVPFFVLATTAPLLQRWFSVTRHRFSADPYVLYAASNAGSLTALLLYPAVIEPFTSLHTQRLAWAAGYLIAAIAVMTCAVTIRRSAVAEADARPADTSPVALGTRLQWLLLSFVPSGLMLAVTSHISTDIAAVPLLWIVPLALYLCTFVIVFSGRAARLLRAAQRILPLALLPLVVFLTAHGAAPLWVMLLLHLLTFFLLALLCHAALARTRPPAEHLTAFYLWMATGGMLGGLFNTIVAPLTFGGIAEYPILLAAACFALAPAPTFVAAVRQPRILGRPAAAGVMTLAALLLGRRLGLQPIAVLPVLGLAALLVFSVSRQPIAFALGVTMMLTPGWVSADQAWGDTVFRRRTFFGVYRVTADHERRLLSLFHGTTLHGSQAAGTGPPEPLAYYHRGGPIADVFSSRPPRTLRSVGVVGLGVGSLAAYARPGERWTFYEIDPMVERIARDDRFFTFLETCGSGCRVAIGDGRLSLARSPDRHDVLVLDAFSSDAIPVHLLTLEAIGLYVSRLSDAGVLAFHISNRHFDLRPVLARAADRQHLIAVVRAEGGLEANPLGYANSMWVTMARTTGALGSLNADPRWHRLLTDGLPTWTDDFSNVWSVLHWR